MKIFNKSNHLDIYLNLNCNLRCKHCFVGDELEKKINFELNSLFNLLEFSRNEGVDKVTFLGGEPTIYPHISKAINKAFELNFEEVRIVTNGTKPLAKVINDFSNSDFKPKIIFSLDSVVETTHDKIRGPRTFRKLYRNIILANDLNFEIAGITSINKFNYHEILKILDFAEKYNFQYLNLHLVSNRGFAGDEIVVTPKDWLELRNKVIKYSENLSYPIKFDRKFIPIEELKSLPLYYDKCFVNEDTDGNVMIMPDGRVYKCALFIDDNKLNSHIWTGNEIIKNIDNINECDICKNKCSGECPGLRMYSSNLYNENVFSTICMYRKEIFKKGKVYLLSNQGVTT